MSPNPFINKLNLSDAEKQFLDTVESQMAIVADLSRADLLLYSRKNPVDLIVVAHAQPHSLAHVYNKARAGRVIRADHRPEIEAALREGKVSNALRSVITEGAPVMRKTLPVFFPPYPGYPDASEDTKPRVIASLVVVTNLIEHERHKFRSVAYQRVLTKIQTMLLAGLLYGAETLSSFGEQDGLVYADRDGIIRYSSGIGANLYRKAGYIDTLLGRHLKDLDTSDEELRGEAISQNRCLETEMEEAGRYWTRKVIPVINFAPQHWSVWQRARILGKPRESGVLIAIHDDTEIRRQDTEIRIKNAMIQEVHHRVKNNLQTIAGLLRMQMRRVTSDEARQVLDEALNRIMSVAVIHEFLSNEGSNIINIKEVFQRIVGQFQAGMISPEQYIRVDLEGDAVYLPARQATACSLIINELLQNSLEHGFELKEEGLIRVNLEDTGDEVIITVADNGHGVAADFNLDQAPSLGLQIIRTLVVSDLKGSIVLTKGIDDKDGLTVRIVFPKTNFKGEEGWNEHVS
jgi:two-component sensor histidine kinase